MAWPWKRAPIVPLPPLDRPLLHWSRQDDLTSRGWLSNLVVIGRTGSGKTSSSGFRLGEAIVAHPPGTGPPRGGLIIAGKPGEDLALWKGIFERAGRSQDLLIFSPADKQPLQFNFLDYVAKHDGQTRNITNCLKVLGESLKAQGRDSGVENAAFFAREEERMLHNSVEMLQKALGRVTAPELQRFITSHATSPEQILSPEWQKGFHHQCIYQAHAKEHTGIARYDLELATEFWLGEVPRMPDKTLGSIKTGCLGTLHVFNTGVVRAMVSEGTDVSPDDILAGKWVLVDCSPAEWGTIGAFLSTGWRFLTQQAVLRRKAQPGDSLVTIWCDEFSQTANSFDAVYLSQCRSHLGSMCVLLQSVSSLYAAFPGEGGKHQADALLSNFGHRVIHACDPLSAEWASSLCGKRLQTFFGGSVAPSQSLYDELFGSQQHLTGSFHQQFEALVQPAVFMNGLRCGGALNAGLVDAIVVRSGEPFSTGENHLRVTFQQPHSMVSTKVKS